MFHLTLNGQWHVIGNSKITYARIMIKNAWCEISLRFRLVLLTNNFFRLKPVYCIRVYQHSAVTEI